MLRYLRELAEGSRSSLTGVVELAPKVWIEPAARGAPARPAVVALHSWDLVPEATEHPVAAVRFSCSDPRFAECCAAWAFADDALQRGAGVLFRSSPLAGEACLAALVAGWFVSFRGIVPEDALALVGEALPRAAVAWEWKSLEKELRAVGPAGPVDRAAARDSAAYFGHAGRRGFVSVSHSKKFAEASGPGEVLELSVRARAAADRGPAPGEPDYWAWVDFGRPLVYSYVFQSRAQVDMCFPYGMSAAERRGSGRPVRVAVERREGRI